MNIYRKLLKDRKNAKQDLIALQLGAKGKKTKAQLQEANRQYILSQWRVLNHKMHLAVKEERYAEAAKLKKDLIILRKEIVLQKEKLVKVKK